MRGRSECPYCKEDKGPGRGHAVRRGWYRRHFDGRKIQRFLCRACKRTFSSLTLTATWRQQKPFLNHTLVFKLCSGMSQRRIARELCIDQKTVARRLVFLGEQARLRNGLHLKNHPPVTQAFFDDMESSIHTKLKPVSIPISMDEKERKIIALQVCSMPAKGRLAAKSLKKYGPRKDERRQARTAVLAALAKVAAPGVEIRSDKCPVYPGLIRTVLPGARHLATKGHRGCVAGQGELKKTRFDPLFPFNQTAAMVRANVNRMFRKTWCTSKRADRLQDHLDLYVWFHNQYLTKNPATKKPPDPMPRLVLRL